MNYKTLFSSSESPSDGDETGKLDIALIVYFILIVKHVYIIIQKIFW